MSNAQDRLATLTATAKDHGVWIGHFQKQSEEFLAALAAIKNETRELEHGHLARVERAKAELEAIKVQITQAKQTHRQLEASIGSLRAEKDKIVGLLNRLLDKRRTA